MLAVQPVDKESAPGDYKQLTDVNAFRKHRLFVPVAKRQVSPRSRATPTNAAASARRDLRPLRRQVPRHGASPLTRAL